jgi:hypothetical protein
LRFVVGDFLRGGNDFRRHRPQVVFRHGLFGATCESQHNHAEKRKNPEHTSTPRKNAIGLLKMREGRDTLSVSKKNGA